MALASLIPFLEIPGYVVRDSGIDVIGTMLKVPVYVVQNRGVDAINVQFETQVHMINGFLLNCNLSREFFIHLEIKT